MLVDGSKLPLPQKKCEKFSKSLVGKQIDTTKTGKKENNDLVNHLRCECKVLKICINSMSVYDNCHRSVMGAGVYEGRPNCAKELEQLLNCYTHDSTT